MTRGRGVKIGQKKHYVIVERPPVSKMLKLFTFDIWDSGAEFQLSEFQLSSRISLIDWEQNWSRISTIAEEVSRSKLSSITHSGSALERAFGHQNLL